MKKRGWSCRAVACLVAMMILAVAAHAAEQTRVWVVFKPNQKATVRAALAQASGFIHYEFDDLRAFAVTVPAQALEALGRNPNIEFIEDDPIRELYVQTIPYGIDKVQARDVWDANRDGVVDSGAPTGAGCKVCVIDSGVYTAHEDLAGLNISGESGTPTAWNVDGCGHGTHVVGTVVAANNTLGVVGVTPGTAPIYMVKVFGDDCGWAYSSDLVFAARRCQAAGAKIISMSLGGSLKSRTEERAFNDLYNQGVLSVAAAGNSGGTQKSYPASYSSVISVAATDQNDVVASFSQKNDQVELAAPGVGVWSTVPWLDANTLTVDGVTYYGNWIENAARGTASGALVDGGLCDSVGSWNGKVVLCRRGSISFNDKVKNVQNGGGVAAVIYNNVSGNFFGTLGSGNSSAIPAISLSKEDGDYLVGNKLGFNGSVVSQSQKPGSGYEAWDGTSMATPHVAGVAALIWSADVNRSNVEIREALQQTAKDLGPAGKDNAYGYGLVQAKDALVFLGGGSPPPPPSGATTVSVVSITYSMQGGKNKDKDIVITLTVRDNLDNPVGGASVSIDLYRNSSRVSSGTGTTSSSGILSFIYRNAPSGTYTTTVTNVSADGLTWDGVTPPNSFTK
jgi:serine protease